MSAIPPRPVAPADSVPAPAVALDTIAAEPTSLQKALAQAKPYLDKTVETVKPYTDAVVAKTQEIVHELHGESVNKPITTENGVAGSSTGNTADRAVAEGHSDLAATAEKAKTLLNQGLGAVSGAFNQVTASIEKNTASSTHPGLITQIQNASHTIVEKADAFFGENPPAMTSAAAVVPPIPTTTNTIAHEKATVL